MPTRFFKAQFSFMHYFIPKNLRELQDKNVFKLNILARISRCQIKQPCMKMIWSSRPRNSAGEQAKLAPRPHEKWAWRRLQFLMPKKLPLKVCSNCEYE